LVGDFRLQKSFWKILKSGELGNGKNLISFTISSFFMIFKFSVNSKKIEMDFQYGGLYQLNKTNKNTMTTMTETKYEGHVPKVVERLLAADARRAADAALFAEVAANPIFINQTQNEDTPFHTNNLFPANPNYDHRYFTPKWATQYNIQYEQNREEFVGFVLKKGQKITQSHLNRLAAIDPEIRKFYVGTTILTVSQTTADHSNQDLYEDITARLDKGKLRYAFKDRIPKGKHILAVLVPTRSNPAWKNCPNYDIPYKAPVMMMRGDKGATKVDVRGFFSMNPLGDAIIVLKN
jgi:hypothetical protein